MLLNLCGWSSAKVIKFCSFRKTWKAEKWISSKTCIKLAWITPTRSLPKCLQIRGSQITVPKGSDRIGINFTASLSCLVTLVCWVCRGANQLISQIKRTVEIKFGVPGNLKGSTQDNDLDGRKLKYYIQIPHIYYENELPSPRTRTPRHAPPKILVTCHCRVARYPCQYQDHNRLLKQKMNEFRKCYLACYVKPRSGKQASFLFWKNLC